MIIDFHTHIGNLWELESGDVAPREALRRSMDSCAVDAAVVLPLPTDPAQRAADRNNSAILRAVAGFDELIPFCTVDFTTEDEALGQLNRALDAGARGLKIHPILQELDLRLPIVRAVVEQCAARDVTVLCHTGQFVPGGHRMAGARGELGPLELAEPLPLDGLAGAVPTARLVLAHFGWPWTEQAIAIMARRENVWLDLSGWPPQLFPATVWTYLSKVRPERFLFGTDFGFIAQERWLREFDSLAPDSVKDLILGANAAQLLSL